VSRPGAFASRWPLVLVGLPGAGKSTVGALVAAQLGVPFVDLDAEIERETGMSIAAIFESRGEAAFRALERETTAQFVNARVVLAVGGGWMVEAGNRALLQPGCQVVHLRVEPHSALARIGPSRAARPLLAGQDPAAALVDLARRRASAYAQADSEVDTEGLAPQQVADAVCASR
jgi:shikimate kinase